MIAEFLFLSKNKLLLNYLLPFGVPNLVIYIYIWDPGKRASFSRNFNDNSSVDISELYWRRHRWKWS